MQCKKKHSLFLARYVGAITTTSYGFSLKRMVGMGFVRKYADHTDDQGMLVEEVLDKDYVRSGKYEVEIAGQRYPVEVRKYRTNLGEF